MAKRINWGRIKHAYVTGALSYRELAKKYDVSLSTLEDVAKKGEWVKCRRQYRCGVEAEALSRAHDEEVDRLRNVRNAADRMGEMIEKIMAEGNQLYMHTGIVREKGGVETIVEKELSSVNSKTLRDLVASMKDLTQVLRNLHGIQTISEAETLAMARERLEMDKRKADAAEPDTKIEIIQAEEGEALDI